MGHQIEDSGIRIEHTLRARDGCRPWPASIARSEGVFDADTRVLYLVAQVPDPYGLLAGAEVTQAPLMMGTFVSAEIAGRTGGDLFVIPWNDEKIAPCPPSDFR